MLLLTNELMIEAGRFFETRGVVGCEGTAMIARSEDTNGVRLVVPEQEANPVPHCWVEVTRSGKMQLAKALSEQDRYVARIHSHPGDAFHSAADDRNPAITFEGAISIVVPFFGLGLRDGLNSCAVFVFRSLHWQELSPGQERDKVVSVRD